MKGPRPTWPPAVAALVAALAALAVVATSCSQERPLDASQAGGDLPDCSASECADELAPIADGAGSLPGVDAVEVAYREKQVTSGASVIGRIDIGAQTSCEALEDDLGRLLWQSQVHPVSSIRLDCYAPGSEETGYEVAGYAFVMKEAADLEQAWGPRGG